MRSALPLVAFVFVLLVAPAQAWGYPWMIRHAYTQCATCHADPVGGGLLNPYGRAQGEILMRMRYGSSPDREPGPMAEPLWGLLRVPDDLLVGGDVRYANIRVIPESGPSQSRFILMQADLLGQFSIGRVRANGSVGYVTEGANGAAITRGGSLDPKLVSRVHWLGIDLGARRQWLLRAGRMALPFGLRSIEHTRFARADTRTDINAAQSYGLAVDYYEGPLRASAMAIAGNFAVAPDHFRSRGYAAFAEYAVQPTAAVGVSSMITHAQLDLAYLTPAFRHAHGAFARYSPFRAAVISAEWDLLFTSQPTPDTNFFGHTGLFSADFEPVQGFHLGPTYELSQRDFGGAASYGYWMSAWWFFLPHADARIDLVGQSLGSAVGPTYVLTAIAQMHVYL